jgi:hypothetical protein
MAGSGWWRWGRAMKLLAAGVDVDLLYFFNEKNHGVWELLARGRGGTQEAKHPTRKAHIPRNLVL